MSYGKGYILLGGGNLAVEIASYIMAADPDRAGAEPGRPLITDIVVQGSRRADEIARIAGAMPEIHERADQVREAESKLAIICVGDPMVREQMLADAMAAGLQMGTIVHPSAVISPTAVIRRGAIVAPLAFVGPFAQIGENSMVNVHVTIGHDAIVGRSTVVSPGAQLNGYARIGDCGFIGAGAVLHPRVALGARSKLSAGSVLTRTVGDGYIMHGNPATGRQMIAVPAPERV